MTSTMLDRWANQGLTSSTSPPHSPPSICLSTALVATAAELTQDQLSLTSRDGGEASFSCGGTDQSGYIRWFQKKDTGTFTLILRISTSDGEINNGYNHPQKDDFTAERQQNSCELKIKKVKPSHAATYYCARWDSGTHISFTVWLIFGSGTKLFVTDRPVVTPVVSVYPAASIAALDGKSSLLCVASNMVPPLVQFSWTRQREGGPLETLSSDDGEQLELRGAGRTAAIMVVDRHANYTYNYQCHVRHEGGAVEAPAEQVVCANPAPTPPAPTPPAQTTQIPTTPAPTPPAPTPPAPTTPAQTTLAPTTPAQTTPATTPPAQTPPAQTPPAQTPPASTTPAPTTPAPTPPAPTPPAQTTQIPTTPAPTPPAPTTDNSSTDDSSTDDSSTDNSSNDASSTDASSTDASSTDASSNDGSSIDNSSTDASSTDASTTDASSNDASSTDASSTDASTTDASSTDASSNDGSSIDNSTTDTSSTDASSTDASNTDTSSTDDSGTDDSSTDASSTDASGGLGLVSAAVSNSQLDVRGQHQVPHAAGRREGHSDLGTQPVLLITWHRRAPQVRTQPSTSKGQGTLI
ncbi:uncharacterized protein LOC133968405 [Platichthys flesus]|uniref:uncharacterized protein LOC133968405 n=1 Tax=Platichthys flesus TaxID=8260 RepID=UPI002DBDD63E|nr:uncharacterized protein LOC133968405 [Platichthys flesus]